MNSRFSAAAVLVLILCVMPAAPAKNISLPAAPFNPGVMVVKLRDGNGDAALARLGYVVIRRSLVPGYALVSTGTDVLGAVARAAADPAIERAEPSWIGRLAISLPNDPCYAITSSPSCSGTSGWHLFAVNAWQGWQRSPAQYYSAAQKQALPASQRVKVAVIDTARAPSALTDFKNGGGTDDASGGGQLDLADAAGFGGLPYDAKPFSFHGTYVAGLVAASANNSFGTAGVGYRADVMPLSAVDGAGHVDSFRLADAIVWAWHHGARVINLSLGLTAEDGLVHDAVRTVTSSASGGSPTPALVVAAAGNNTFSQPFYPGSWPEVMSVGGTDVTDSHAGCANFNPNVSVSAPAAFVQGLDVDNTLRAPECGTSAAAPQVSGLAALLISQNPARTPAQVRSIIEQSADDLGARGRDDYFGWGRINVDRALALGQGAASGPQISGVTATPIRPNGGGTSTIRATASGSSAITDAEFFIDQQPVDASERSVYQLSPADGSFNSPTEPLAGSFGTPTIIAGPHRMYLRAKNAAGVWGPLSTAVLYVDGVRPTVTAFTATNVIPLVQPSAVVSFVPADDWSATINYDLDIMFLGQPSFTTYHAGVASVPSGVQQNVTWTPPATAIPGTYSVRLIVRDEAGNMTTATASFTLV